MVLVGRAGSTLASCFLNAHSLLAASTAVKSSAAPCGQSPTKTANRCPLSPKSLSYSSVISSSKTSVVGHSFGSASSTSKLSLISSFRGAHLSCESRCQPEAQALNLVKKPMVMASASVSFESTKGPFGIPIATHLLCLAVPAAFALTFFNGTRFGYHPTFLATGYLFLMAEGILISIQAKGKQRQFLLKLHAVLLGAATASIIVGMWAIYTNKIINGKPHFTTIHGKVGLLSLVSGSLVSLGGIPALYGLPKALRKYTVRVNKAHKMFGATAFIGGIVAVFLGLQVANPSHPLNKGMSTYALASSTLLLALLVLKKSFLARQAKGVIVAPSPAQKLTSAVTNAVEKVLGKDE